MSDNFFYKTFGCSRDELLEESYKSIRDKLNDGIPYGYKQTPNGELVPHIGQQRIIHLEKNLKNKGHTFEEISDMLADEVVFTEEELQLYKDRNPEY